MPTKKNPFACFMDDLKKKANREGRPFRSMSELVAYAGPLWEELDPNEKKIYKIKAKSITASEKEATNRSSSTGLNDYEKIKQEEEHIMNATIKKTITELDEYDLLNKKFYLCHINYFYGSGTTYMPCEIGLIEFSLISGISKTLQFIVHGQNIPIGYRFDVEERSNRYHGIPIDWCTSSPNNHDEILKKIVEFLDPENLGHFPPIYSMPDNDSMNFSMSAVKSSLALFGKAGNASPDIFRVYSLTSLFNEIINAANVKMGIPENTYLALPEREICRDRFVTFKNIACGFHLRNDLFAKCSLSIVTRWAYTIIANYSNITGIEINLGNDNKSRSDWKMLQSCPYKSVLDNSTVGISPANTVNKEHLERNKAIREAQRIQEEQLAEQNSEIRPPHPLTLTAHMSDELLDIGKFTITRSETQAPVWPKELFRNKK